MRQRRSIAAAITAVTAAAALLLSACGGGTSANDSTEATSGSGSSDSSESSAPAAEDVTLTIQSWRVEDADIWRDKIIPAYESSHPGVHIKYDPTATTEYDAAVDARMKGGTAGDLIYCRPYEVTRNNIKKGYFAQIDGEQAVSQFDDATFGAWALDDGHKYCLPLAAIYGLVYYNKAIFNELGIAVPTTHDEFIAALQKIKDDGTYDPIALGSAEPWVLSGNGLDIIGAPYWKGEEGRQGLLDGTKKFTDPDFVAGIQAFGDLRPFLPQGQEALTYADEMQLYGSGKAATWITGSWEINTATADGLDSGVFPAPVPAAGDGTYLQVHPDTAIGVNAASPHQKEALEFLNWLASDEFLSIFTNAIPGFYSLRKDPPAVDNALAKEMQKLAADAAGWTPRLVNDRLGAGNPSLENEEQTIMQQYMGDPSMTAADAAQKLQDVYDISYKPAGN